MISHKEIDDGNGLSIDLREVLKEMLVVGDFTFHSGKKALLKFDIDKIPKDLGEFIFKNGMKVYGQIPAIIMNGGFKFLPKGYRAILVYPDLISDNNLINHALYLPVGLRNMKVCLIDDVVTTGKAMDDAEKILNDNGFIVKRKICLLNRGDYKCESLINKEEMIGWLGL